MDTKRTQQKRMQISLKQNMHKNVPALPSTKQITIQDSIKLPTMHPSVARWRVPATVSEDFEAF